MAVLPEYRGAPALPETKKAASNRGAQGSMGTQRWASVQMQRVVVRKECLGHVSLEWSPEGLGGGKESTGAEAERQGPADKKGPSTCRARQVI